jgi:DNA-binding HxlR family transcriptional regulator
MERKSFSNMQCPIARSLERVGEWWSILILRDALQGLTRFEQFQKSLDIAPNMLTRRLTSLVEAGLLERRRYSERPPRDEYVLTGRGEDLWPVIVVLYAWGNKHFAPEGASVVLIDEKTGEKADPLLVDRVSGRLLDQADFGFVAGPAAGERTRRRLAFKRHERGKRREHPERSTKPATPRPGAAARADGSRRADRGRPGSN